MAGQQDTSTDRLLELVRGKGGGAAAVGDAAPKKSAVSVFKSAGGTGSGRSRGALTVGVDIGNDAVRLAKIGGTDAKPKLMGVKRIPYGPGETPDQPGFQDFLREQLKSYCGAARNVEIWSLVSSAKAELWHITIPKVPQNQIQEAVYWTVKKEKQFDENEFILDFEKQREVMEKGVPKLAVMVYLAPRKQVADLQNLFTQIGYKPAGATISPIAIQTLFRSKWVVGGAKTFAHLYVGRNWSRIDIFIDDNIVLSRGIKAGTNSMVEALMENYNAMARRGGAKAAPVAATMIDEPVISLTLDDDAPTMSASVTKETPGGARMLDVDGAKRVLKHRLLGQDMRPGESGAELSEEEVLRMIRPAAERLVRQVERTFEYHTTTMGNERVEKIFFSGEICTNQMLLEFIHSQLGIEYHLLDPLAPENPAVGPAAAGVPLGERLSFNLVTALGISSNTITPNLLYTFKDKERDRKARFVDKIIYAAGALALLVLIGVSFYMFTVNKRLEADLEMHTRELQKFVPPASEAMLMAEARKVNAKILRLKAAALKYESMALLAELTQLTPENVDIKFVSVDVDFGDGIKRSDLNKRMKPRDNEKERKPRSMLLDGVILGERENFENAFTRYLIKIENSKLFKTPTIITRKEEEFLTSGNVFRFNVRTDLK